MSTTTINAPDRNGGFSNFLAGIAAGFTAYAERRARMDKIERLNSLSDAELAKLGITRDGIAHYVFRDLFYI